MIASINSLGYLASYAVKKQSAPPATQQPSQAETEKSNAQINLKNSINDLDNAITEYELDPSDKNLTKVDQAKAEAQRCLKLAKDLGVTSSGYYFIAVENRIIDLVTYMDNQIIIGKYLIRKDEYSQIAIYDNTTGDKVNKTIGDVLKEELGSIQMDENLACSSYMLGVLNALWTGYIKGKNIDVLDLYYRSYSRDNAEDPKPKASAKEVVTQENIDKIDADHKALKLQSLEDSAAQLDYAIRVYNNVANESNKEGLKQALAAFITAQRVAANAGVEYDNMQSILLIAQAQGLLVKENKPNDFIQRITIDPRFR